MDQRTAYQHLVALIRADEDLRFEDHLAQDLDFVQWAMQSQSMPLIYAIQGIQAASNPELWKILRNLSLQSTAAEMQRKSDLIEFAKALSEAKIPWIALKGTALAYQYYDSPHLRPRVDLDVLIQSQDLSAVKGILKKLLYTQIHHSGGETNDHQIEFVRRGQSGLASMVDVHWHISQRKLLEGLPGFDTLWKTRQILKVEDVQIAIPSAVHLTLHACVHSAMHHFNMDVLIWSYDLHLLMERFTDQECTELVELALGHQVGSICMDQIERSHARFPTPQGEKILQSLRAQVVNERSQILLRPNLSWKRRLVMDWLSISSLTGKLSYLWTLIFPAREFMNQRFGLKPGKPGYLLRLCGAYSKRLAQGLLKGLFRRQF